VEELLLQDVSKAALDVRLGQEHGHEDQSSIILSVVDAANFREDLSDEIELLRWVEPTEPHAGAYSTHESGHVLLQELI
jgi:hypothetical protein